MQKTKTKIDRLCELLAVSKFFSPEAKAKILELAESNSHNEKLLASLISIFEKELSYEYALLKEAQKQNQIINKKYLKKIHALRDRYCAKSQEADSEQADALIKNL